MSFYRTNQMSNCPRCNHPQTPAVHGINVLGVTQCMMCPEGKCTEVAAQQVDPLMTVAGNGLALIGEMSNHDLIEEIILAQRKFLAAQERAILVRTLVHLRTEAVRERLRAEAGITDSGWDL